MRKGKARAKSAPTSTSTRTRTPTPTPTPTRTSTRTSTPTSTPTPTRRRASSEARLRKDLVEVCRRLYARDLIGAGEGNVSCRLGGGELLVTPSGACKGYLAPEDLVVVTEAGEVVRGPGRASTELRMHLAAYAARRDAAAIVHAHPVAAVALTVAGLPPPNDVMPEASVVLGEVAVAPFATPGTDEVPRALGPLLARHDVVLLERHGALALGRTLWEALDRIETLERVARVATVARLLGRCEPLAAEAVAKVLAAAGVARH